MNSHDIWTQHSAQLISKSQQLREQSMRLCAESKDIVTPPSPSSLVSAPQPAETPGEAS